MSKISAYSTFQETFVPIGISIREKNGISPDRYYSMIPDKMLVASRHEGAQYAKSARLYENSAWCAPTDSTVDHIQV